MNAPLRMKDLVARTGASREAIRYYINEGLLPEPRKTSRNMAWYSPEHVERIQYIRALQDEHFLPLKAIRAVLDGQAAEHFTPHQRHQFEVLRARVRARHAGETRTRFATVAAELKLSDDEQAAARDMGLVNADGTVGPQDEELLRLWADNRDRGGLTPERGFSPRDMQILIEAVEMLFAAELKMFTERLGDMDDAELVKVLDRIIPNTNRAFALLHQRRVQKFLDETDTGTNPGGDPR